jgi:hypothetical protein
MLSCNIKPSVSRHKHFTPTKYEVCMALEFQVFCCYGLTDRANVGQLNCKTKTVTLFAQLLYSKSSKIKCYFKQPLGFFASMSRKRTIIAQLNCGFEMQGSGLYRSLTSFLIGLPLHLLSRSSNRYPRLLSK